MCNMVVSIPWVLYFWLRSCQSTFHLITCQLIVYVFQNWKTEKKRCKKKRQKSASLGFENEMESSHPGAPGITARAGRRWVWGPRQISMCKAPLTLRGTVGPLQRGRGEGFHASSTARAWATSSRQAPWEGLWPLHLTPQFPPPPQLWGPGWSLQFDVP